MKLVRIQAPVNPAVTLAEVKNHLKIRQANTAQDTDLQRVADGCVNELDGWDGHLGRALITQRWSLFLDSFPSVIELPLPPLQAVTCLKHMNADGDWVHLASSEYRVSGIGGNAKAEIYPAIGKTWPTVYPARDSIEVRFRCGFGDDATTIPGSLKNAILEMIGARTSVRDGVVRAEERMLPIAAMPGLQSLDHWRVWV
jgi:uncharacterized phiE125 gp8 family phage protein